MVQPTRRRPTALAGVAILVIGACAPAGPPRRPADLLARVPADASFVASLDLAALRDDALARETGLADAWLRAVSQTLASLGPEAGIDSAEDLDHLLVSGDLASDPPWALGELWGRFDPDGMAAALAAKGFVERDLEGRRALVRDGDGSGDAAVWIVPEGRRHLSFGTEEGLARRVEGRSLGLAPALAEDPLARILDADVAAFGVYLRPAFDPDLLEGLPLAGAVLGRLLLNLEGLSGAMRLDDGFVLSGRARTRRESDAETLAALARGGLDLARGRLAAVGEPEVAEAAGAAEIGHDGALVTFEVRLRADLARRLAARIAGKASGGAAANAP